MTQYTAMNNSIIVKIPEKQFNTLESGIVVISHQPDQVVGEVLSVGQRFDAKGEPKYSQIKVGDKVLLTKGTGLVLDTAIVLVKHEDIFGILQ